MSRDLVDEYASTGGEPNLQGPAAKLVVPTDFNEWCATLPPKARQRLSIHDLRQIWEPMREGLQLVLPYLDASGVFHRHNGVDFPKTEHCPYCQLDGLHAELERERQAREQAEREREEARVEISLLRQQQIGDETIVREARERAEAAETKAAAMVEAIPFAIGAIEDAIFLDDGIDGDTGMRVIHILREAVERGTFGKAEYGSLPRPHADITCDAVREALAIDDEENPVDAIVAIQQRIAKLEDAAIALRDDMLMRAKLQAEFRGDDDVVVEASNSIWHRFCDAIPEPTEADSGEQP